MLRHIFILIWNRKRKNVLLIAELVFSFFILFSVMSFVLFNLDRYKTPLGFDTENVWITNFSMPEGLDSATRVDIKTQLLQRVGELPEIEAVSFSNEVAPLSGSTWQSTTSDNGYEISAHQDAGDEHYARALGLDVIEGRWFTREDELSKYKPIIINKLMRDTYWKDTVVIGKVIKWMGERQIVGVIDHYKYHGEFTDEPNVVITSFPMHSVNTPKLIMRLKSNIAPDFEVKVNALIKDVAKGWQFVVLKLEDQRKWKSRAKWIPIIALLSICGFLIFNVSLGLFGVLIYNIKKRKSEIGLRRAVGSTPRGISMQFIIEICLITTMALIIGVFFAAQLPLMNVFDVATTIYLRAILFSCLIIYSLVLICTIYPSRQASSVHPATALHEE